MGGKQLPLVITDTAVADGASDQLRVGMSVRIGPDGRVERIAPDGEVDRAGAEVLDGGGATVVPALVDCHSHLTMPGGSHWIARGDDAPDVLRQVARDNARRLVNGETHAGRIDEGAPADLVLVHGDPLSDPRAVAGVGRVPARGARGMRGAAHTGFGYDATSAQWRQRPSRSRARSR